MALCKIWHINEFLHKTFFSNMSILLHSTEKLTGCPWPFLRKFLKSTVFFMYLKKNSIYYCKYLTSTYTIINYTKNSLVYILKFNFSSPFLFSFQQWLSLLKNLVVKEIGAKVRFQPNIVGCSKNMLFHNGFIKRSM